MREHYEEQNEEIKIRGRIITASLFLEFEMEFAIYVHFGPKNQHTDTLNLYLKEFILPIQFGKKVKLFKELLKTKTYQNKLNIFLKSPPQLMKNSNDAKHLRSKKTLQKFIDTTITEILELRNTIAHGFKINRFFKTKIKKGTFILSNNRKRKVINIKTIEPIINNVYLASLIINHLMKIDEDKPKQE